jgi:hypothetical protein
LGITNGRRGSRGARHAWGKGEEPASESGKPGEEIRGRRWRDVTNDNTWGTALSRSAQMLRFRLGSSRSALLRYPRKLRPAVDHRGLVGRWEWEEVVFRGKGYLPSCVFCHTKSVM